jgi:hypothetical protein
MAKQEAEQSNSLSIFWLKKNGYLPIGGGWRSGGIKWTHKWSGNESSIGFTVMTDEQDNWNEDNYVRLQYARTNPQTGEKENMDYKVPLTSTPCNYGGVRYWFVCPLYKNGQYCGRRVGVIYSIGKWFGCRHCGEIAYRAQFEGGNFRAGSITEPQVERAREEVRRKYYNGKPTRKYKRYLRLRKKMDDVWAKAAKKFGVIF